MCDSLLFIDGGRLVYHGDAEALKHGHSAGDGVSATMAVLVNVAGDPRPLVEWAQTNPGWSVLEERRDGARLAREGSDPALLADGLRRIVAAGISVVEFHREQRRLEEAFVDMVRERR
jgi:ABC-2 type transport system ATP-binding protein